MPPALRTAAVALVLLLPLWHGQAVAQSCPRATLVGTVGHVRDGDTIEVDGLPVRLQGLAAPELDEPGGEEAGRALWMLLHGQEVRCELTGERSYDRCIGVCYLGGADIAAELVRAGAARDCPRFSGGRYAEEERAAAREGAGIAETYRLPGYLPAAALTAALALDCAPPSRPESRPPGTLRRALAGELAPHRISAPTGRCDGRKAEKPEPSGISAPFGILA